MQSLIEFLTEILAWLVDLLLWVPRKLYELLLDGLALVLEALPVPEWLSGGDPFGAIDPGVAYFAGALEMPTGIGIILGAYLIRFIIRRIPVVG